MARYYLIAFTVGAAVLIAEIAAARAIAPHFGTSIVVWTNVIGIILVALAVGYWLGGRLAERRPAARVLGSIMILAAALLLIPAFLTRTIAGTVILDGVRFGSGFATLLLGSFLSVVLLFALPIALLGMVAPFLVKLATVHHRALDRSGECPSCHQRTDVGAIAGRLYAVSTIGSLVGTFLPPLILLPLLGTRRTILVAAALLFLVGAFLVAHRRRAVAASIAAVALLFVPASPPPWIFGGDIVAAADSRYQYLRIVDHPSITEADGTERVLIFNEGLSIQSIAVTPGLEAPGYFSIMGGLPAFIADDPVEVLILGNAGGTIGHLMQQWFPNRALHLTGVEIDPVVTELTRAAFSPPPDPYPIIHADSRTFVRDATVQYNIIVVDAYTNQLTIPAHLATREFFADVRARLAPGGFAAFNINAPSRDSQLLQTLLQTMTRAFPEVALGYTGSSWNYIAIAGDTSLASRAVQGEGLPDRLLAELEGYRLRLEPISRNDMMRVFTDDWAPLELMTDIEVFEAYRSVRGDR